MAMLRLTVLGHPDWDMSALPFLNTNPSSNILPIISPLDRCRKVDPHSRSMINSTIVHLTIQWSNAELDGI